MSAKKKAGTRASSKARGKAPRQGADLVRTSRKILSVEERARRRIARGEAVDRKTYEARKASGLVAEPDRQARREQMRRFQELEARRKRLASVMGKVKRLERAWDVRDARAAQIDALLLFGPPSEADMARVRELYARVRRAARSESKAAPIAYRVIKSQAHIGHLMESVRERGTYATEDLIRIEFVDALWWEIRAIEHLRKIKKRGRKTGAIGANQKILRDLLAEKQDAKPLDAVLRLNDKNPGHGFTRKTVRGELSKARKARGITKSR